MVMKTYQYRHFASDRMTRTRKKNHSVLILATGMLFLGLCWNYRPPVHQSNTSLKTFPQTQKSEEEVKQDDVQDSSGDIQETLKSKMQLEEQFSQGAEQENLNADISSDENQIGTTIPHIHGGIVFDVPIRWNRLHTPWFHPDPVKLMSPEESKHRYLYAATRISTSDGIGHSMGVVNRDFNFAISLNLTYTHRIGTYSSLTYEDKNAVEEFFGWGSGEIPREKIQEEGCFPQGGAWPDLNQTSECHICERHNPNGKLGIKYLVEIPADMRSNCLHPDDPCQPYRRRFLRENQKSHTIFQASKEICSPPATDNNFLLSKSLFFHKYWDRHGLRPWLSSGSGTRNGTRPIRYSPEELNIAIHIRRGDFLLPETQAKRGITKDEVFAKVLVNALAVIQQEGGIFSEMPIVVHVYSEGMLQKGSVSSIHMIELQDSMYYDSNGTQRSNSWWKELILRTLSESNTIGLEAVKERLTVVFHISEDTLLCLHEMVSADLFIGSKSGLSNALVWSLSRGLVLIPSAPTINTEKGKKGNICCSLPFANENGLFDTIQFATYWKVYSQANSRSASRTRTS